MSAGFGFLQHLLDNRLSPATLSDQGLTVAMFTTEERRAYDFICQFYADYGEVPARRTVIADGDVTWPTGLPVENLDYWTDRLKRREQERAVLNAAQAMQRDCADGRLEAAIERVRGLVLELDPMAQTDTLFTLEGLSSVIVADHDRKQRTGTATGVPFGIPYLDTVSGGAQPADTLALVGRPGTGKSYLMLAMALAAWAAGFTPLFLTMEMSAVQCVRRLLALLAKVNPTCLRLGRLGYFARELLVNEVSRILSQGADHPRFYVLQGSLTSTVEDLALRVRETKPSIVYVDGAYLLRTRNRGMQRWERVTETAEYLKTLSLTFGIPVLETYQFNRRGPGSLGNIAFSDAVGQLASIVISIDDDSEGEETFAARQFKTLELIKGREGERGKLRMVYDIQRMEIAQDSVIQGRREMLEERDDYGGDY